MMRQRRIYVSPTLIYYQISSFEESNRVIRSFKEHGNHFARVTFVNDQFEQGYYFTNLFNLFVGYIHRILSHGLALGPYKFTFLSYSNS